MWQAPTQAPPNQTLPPANKSPAEASQQPNAPQQWYGSGNYANHSSNQTAFSNGAALNQVGHGAAANVSTFLQHQNSPAQYNPAYSQAGSKPFGEAPHQAQPSQNQFQQPTIPQPNQQNYQQSAPLNHPDQAQFNPSQNQYQNYGVSQNQQGAALNQQSPSQPLPNSFHNTAPPSSVQENHHGAPLNSRIPSHARESQFPNSGASPSMQGMQMKPPIPAQQTPQSQPNPNQYQASHTGQSLNQQQQRAAVEPPTSVIPQSSSHGQNQYQNTIPSQSAPPNQYQSPPVSHTKQTNAAYQPSVVSPTQSNVYRASHVQANQYSHYQTQQQQGRPAAVPAPQNTPAQQQQQQIPPTQQAQYGTQNFQPQEREQYNYSAQRQNYPAAAQQRGGNDFRQDYQQQSQNYSGQGSWSVLNPVDLLSNRKVLSENGLPLAPKPKSMEKTYKPVRLDSDQTFRSTLGMVPRTPSLLNKSELPFGLLVHPFKELDNLEVLSPKNITRCKICRTYINPYAHFLDNWSWKCNMCGKRNDVPPEFHTHPHTNQPVQVQQRPEVTNTIIEYIASQEYALRPPESVTLCFLLDVSFVAMQSGYVEHFCQTLQSCLSDIPGDSRKGICIIAFDVYLHFFLLRDDGVWTTVACPTEEDNIHLISPDNLIIKVDNNMEALADLLTKIPLMFKDTREYRVALGPCLQGAYKLMSPIGGRVSVFLASLPNVGDGALTAREDPNERSSRKINHIKPTTDFYKKISLDCANVQVGVDYFLFGGQYMDISSIAEASNYSAGHVHYYPKFNAYKTHDLCAQFTSDLERYITRPIGVEAVMRIRCSNGLTIKEFYGNFFVRSPDLVVIPVVSPDDGYAISINFEESIPNDKNNVCLQAALLYTSEKGERRIRVHTVSIPVTSNLEDVFAYADQEAVMALIGRCATKQLLRDGEVEEARNSLQGCSEDIIRAFSLIMRSQRQQIMIPRSLSCVPLLILSCLKNYAFRVGISTTLDQRIYALQAINQSPIGEILYWMYPKMYAVHDLINVVNQAEAHHQENVEGTPSGQGSVDEEEDELDISFAQLHLSMENIFPYGCYVLESGMHSFMYIRSQISDEFVKYVFGLDGGYKALEVKMANSMQIGLPELDNKYSDNLRYWYSRIGELRGLRPPLRVILESNEDVKVVFLRYLHDDRLESTPSYVEYLKTLNESLRGD